MNARPGLSATVSPPATVSPSETVSLWRHVRAIALLPLLNVVAIPAAIVVATDSAGGAARVADLMGALRLSAGAALVAGGLILVSSAIQLFVRQGHGTLAPWDPPTAFVLAGPYRRCRHPMKLGLFLILLGHSLIFASLPLLVWFAAFAAVNAVYIAVSEEPALRRRFGKPYHDYCSHVPRWLPRRTPWTPVGEAAGERA
ncbi:MAG: isoprenylcysteine carboxylmethyltransferase family protein [Gammaproteobacteria bacterium]|nr:isoprenylcysteine carboxylmethyltransferase family protein [Gammaproteobacteria bacterium]